MRGISGFFTGSRLLWITTVMTWASAAVATADRATAREWVLAVLAALFATLMLVQVKLMPRRFDRLRRADEQRLDERMDALAHEVMLAAMTRQLPDLHGPHPRLQVVETSRPLSRGTVRSCAVYRGPRGACLRGRGAPRRPEAR